MAYFQFNYHGAASFTGTETKLNVGAQLQTFPHADRLPFNGLLSRTIWETMHQKS